MTQRTARAYCSSSRVVRWSQPKLGRRRRACRARRRVPSRSGGPLELALDALPFGAKRFLGGVGEPVDQRRGRRLRDAAWHTRDAPGCNALVVVMNDPRSCTSRTSIPKMVFHIGQRLPTTPDRSPSHLHLAAGRPLKEDMSNSDQRRYVIVGNGFAGTTCAEHLRKLDPACSIVMFADEPYPLYNRIALPPLLRKQVTQQKVIMRDLAWHEKHAIELHLATRVERSTRPRKRSYAAGTAIRTTRCWSRPAAGRTVAEAPGAGARATSTTFNTWTTRRRSRSSSRRRRSAVAVGGSFIAYELAEAFASRGVETHWLVRGPRFLRRMLDEIAGEMVDDAAREDGVHVHYGENCATRPLERRRHQGRHEIRPRDPGGLRRRSGSGSR
jgi:hypothetical protein